MSQTEVDLAKMWVMEYLLMTHTWPMRGAINLLKVIDEEVTKQQRAGGVTLLVLDQLEKSIRLYKVMKPEPLIVVLSHLKSHVSTGGGDSGLIYTRLLQKAVVSLASHGWKQPEIDETWRWLALDNNLTWAAEGD